MTTYSVNWAAQNGPNGRLFQPHNFKSAADNCKEFMLGKNTITLLKPHSILQNQVKTTVLPVLPPTPHLNLNEK